uniref:Type I polyketide synthase ketoyl reductase domain protein n=1 Tax=Gambierdiscus excentricus TaxID=986170 RepID=A0A1S6K8D1_9DINO|nr:type I polyketide synthase ketoyl reductase domain protein [Gambierdiscus excentricus]
MTGSELRALGSCGPPAMAKSPAADVKQKVVKAEDNMCWPVEWFSEDVPLENKEGNSLDKQVEAWYNETITVPRLFEKFVEVPKNLQPLELPAVELPLRESVLVFADSLDICQQILEAAPEGRIGTRKIVDDIRNSVIDSHDVARHINEQPGGWDLIIFGYGMEPPKVNNGSSVIEQQNSAARLFLWVLQEVAKTELTTTRIAVVTRGAFTEDPGEHRRCGVQIVSGAPLFGMSNSARLEMEVRIQYIDTEWSISAMGSRDTYRLYPRIASEIFRQQTFGHNSVRIIKSGRYVLRRVASAPYEAARRDFELPTSGTIAITGCGSLGLVMGQWLLDQAARAHTNGFKLRFLSRTGMPYDRHLPMWQSLKDQADELDVLVDVKKCDVGNPHDVDKFVDSMQGHLTGFIHTASVVRDSMLSTLTTAKCDEVFKPKHQGALHLHTALERHENSKLSFFWLFSHTSVYGNLGQINYSGTNACLDALARHRAGRGRPAVSVQWGNWADLLSETAKETSRKRSDLMAEPNITKKEAFRGLRVGLKTGLPVFGVLKLNQQFLRDNSTCETHLECYKRNWQSEIIPVMTPAPTMDRKHMYTVFRECQGSYQNHPDKKRLVFDAYTQGFVEEFENEWGDDFRKWKS